ncbi:MAG: hypothetical protein IJ870_02800 [Alphaproteobacteria bacterium]|nr:hypothetical protein [Alphaproteobacteria bacterium]
MIKYALKTFVLFGVVLALGACKTAQKSDTSIRAQEWQPQINMPVSVVVCRAKQCAPAKLSMSKEYIYNSLMHLLEQNAHEKALICQADPFTHVCTEDYVTLPITVGVTPANMYLNDVDITDISVALNRRSIDLLLNYGVSYNGQTPTCKPAKSLVYVKNTQNIVLEDNGYMCKMTTIGNTTIKTLFAIDYIDLDYGFIGGYYSIGLSGPAYGGRSGYMMFKLKNISEPLNADLILQEPQKTEEEMKAELKAQLKEELREEIKAEVIAEQQVVEATPFEGYECYSTELEPMPCYEEWPCYEEEAVGKIICPEPQAENFTIITETGEQIERSKGVIMPKAIKNIKNQKAVNTKNIKPTKNETTNMSVYNPPVSQDVKGTEYNGVEVFPIYQKKK